MKHILSIFLAAALCATATAQTIRTLGYNTTNGVIVANTGTNVLTFTNDVNFGSGDLSVSGQVISGSHVSLSFEDGSFSGVLILDDGSSIGFQGASLATTRANLGFSTNLNTLWTATNAATARTNLSLGLPALTNTSNVTMIQALSGAAAAAYNGTIIFTNIQGIVVSNGIIVDIEE